MPPARADYQSLKCDAECDESLKTVGFRLSSKKDSYKFQACTGLQISNLTPMMVKNKLLPMGSIQHPHCELNYGDKV